MKRMSTAEKKSKCTEKRISIRDTLVIASSRYINGVAVKIKILFLLTHVYNKNVFTVFRFTRNSLVGHGREILESPLCRVRFFVLRFFRPKR